MNYLSQLSHSVATRPNPAKLKAALRDGYLPRNVEKLVHEVFVWQQSLDPIDLHRPWCIEHLFEKFKNPRPGHLGSALRHLGWIPIARRPRRWLPPGVERKPRLTLDALEAYLDTLSPHQRGRISVPELRKLFSGENLLTASTTDLTEYLRNLGYESFRCWKSSGCPRLWRPKHKGNNPI